MGSNRLKIFQSVELIIDLILSDKIFKEVEERHKEGTDTTS